MRVATVRSSNAAPPACNGASRAGSMRMYWRPYRSASTKTRRPCGSVARRSNIPPDHAGRQVFFDAVGRSRRRCAQEPRLELLAVGAVVDPFAGGRDPLAGGNGGGMANHGHDVTMPARPGAQNAKAVLGVVVGYSLDEARQHLTVGWFRLDLHQPRYSVRACCISKHCTG